MKTRAIRYDEAYGRHDGGVRANRLFPPLRGLRAMPRENPELLELYDQLAQLLAKPDAHEPESETAAAIAQLDARITVIENAEADELLAELDAGLLMPLGAGAEAARTYDRLIAIHADPAADDTTA